MADTVTTTYEIGPGLKVVNGILMADTTDDSQKDNMQPITSNGVAIEIGNLDALLRTV